MIKENSFILEDGQLDYQAIQELTTAELVEELKLKIRNCVVKKFIYENNSDSPSCNFTAYLEGRYQDFAIVSCYYGGHDYYQINKIHRYELEDVLGFKLTQI